MKQQKKQPHVTPTNVYSYVFNTFSASSKSGTSFTLAAGRAHLTNPLLSTANAPPSCHLLPLSTDRFLHARTYLSATHTKRRRAQL